MHIGVENLFFKTGLEYPKIVPPNICGVLHVPLIKSSVTKAMKINISKEYKYIKSIMQFFKKEI